MRPRALTQAGFTLFEALVALLVLGAVTAAATSLARASDQLSDQGRAHMRATALHRTNHGAIAEVLRAADERTWTGFDPATEVATQPGFRRVLGVLEDGTRSLGDPETVLWLPSAQAVPGIPGRVGGVWLRNETGDVLLACNVPENAFSVHREGRAMVVRLATYYHATGYPVVRLESTGVVTTRN
jgi:type II secretory pathway pseudopilin PulG